MWLLWIIKLFYIQGINANLAHEVKDLTLIFFANLNVDTSLISSTLTSNSINFINKQTENYIAIMKDKYGINHHGLTKRSAEYNAEYVTGDYDGTRLFNGFYPLNIEPAEDASDIFFVYKNKVLTTITLGNTPNNTVTLYKQKNLNFYVVFKEFVGPADKILVHKGSLETFVIITNFRKVVIYTMSHDTLKKMQKLDGNKLNDIIIWENRNGIFLSIVRKGTKWTLDTTCYIYKWLGKHFDLVQELNIYGVKKISAVSVGNVNFLALAKYKRNDGQPTTYSEIYKYNIHAEKYEIYQNVLTSGAVDMQFFSLKRGNQKEIFCVVANSLEDKNIIQNQVTSIIYKYVDKHFYPFQSIPKSVDKWLPITGPNDEFLLISISKTEGLKLYNYDGWRFVETKSNRDDFSRPEVSINGYQRYAGNLVIKLSDNKVDKRIRLYRLNFLEENGFNVFQDDMLQWCQKTLAETDDFDVNKLQEAMLTSPKVDTVKEYSPEVKTDAAKESEDYKQEEESYEDSIPKTTLFLYNGMLESQLATLKEIKANLKNCLQDSDVLLIDKDVIVDNLILEKEAFFEGDLKAETINDDDLQSMLNGLININNDYDFEENITFNIIKAEEMIEPNYINENKLEDLVLVNDSVELEDVIVNGKVIFNNGLTVGGEINGIYLNSSKILLAQGDQVFNEDIVLKTVRVNSGESDYLNKLNLRSIPEISSTTISNIKNLNVKELIIGELLNDVDINVLNENALRTFGDQEISGNYTFESLELNDLFLEGLLFNKDPNDAILINHGEYNISRNALFTGDVNAKKIHVRNRINHLKVDDTGKVDALLKDTEENQHVNGYKIFEEVQLLNPINLQVKLDSNQLKNMNPIKIVPDEEIAVEGDYNITGKVTVEKLLLSSDMKGSNSNKTVNDVIFSALEIDSVELPHHFIFQQQLNVGEINVDLINDINPDNFVINGDGIVQNIKGSKTIKSDVHITGSTTLVNVNNIHIPYLEENTLKTEGDQEITGKHVLQELVAISVTARTINLGDHPWKDIVKISDNQRIHGTTTVNSSLSIRTLTANSMEIEGLLNNYNFNDLMEDTADFNTSEITAHKTFDRLEVDNLYLANGINMENVGEILKNYENSFRIEENIVLPNNIRIEELNVEGRLNDMRSEDFTKNWVEKTEDQLFSDNYTFDTVTVYGKATILSGEINGISLKDIFENTIKANETFYFNDVTFKQITMSKGPVLIHGHISGLDLENIIVSSREEQTISGSLTFMNTVDVMGKLEFNGLINGVDYKKLCEFSIPDPDESEKNLIITENADFLRGPSLKKINNVSITDLYEDIWIRNRDTKLNGHIQFETMNFEHNATVRGLVDGVDVTWLSENYFSKKKDQTITGHLDFTDGVNFFSSISAPEMQVKGLVSGENIMEFIATAILNNVEQIFDNTLILEKCTITDLNGDYLVNELNLPNDVMRYDVDNVVTGKKEIPNVIVDNLIIKQSIPIQNVYLLEWMQNTLPKTGGAFTGHCMFNNDVSFSNGLGVVGLVNGVKFDNKNIMLRNEEQIITGKKTFQSHALVLFENIYLNTTLNGVNMTKLLDEQAFKNTDNVFKSQINIAKDVKTKNVNIKQLYNGVNINELLTKLMKSGDLNNYFENYTKLLDTANIIKESFEHQAYFLHHYEFVQYFEKSWELYYLPYRNLPCVAVINNNIDSITLYAWNRDEELFNNHLDTLVLGDGVKYVSIITFGNDTFVYYELFDENDIAQGVGAVLAHINNIDYGLVHWDSNPAKYLHAFTLPDKRQNCFVITFERSDYPMIYCQAQYRPGFYQFQELEVHTSWQISTLGIGQDVYLFIVCHNIQTAEQYADIYVFDRKARLFNKHQTIFDSISPISISVISYRDAQYIAIADGRLPGSVYEGLVHVYRFNSDTKYFVPFQDINVNAPVQVQFAVLPSEELILYVLTDNISEPLVVYQLEGVFGFKQIYLFASLAKMYKMKVFNTMDGEHFVLGQSYEHMTLLRSHFKGHY